MRTLRLLTLALVLSSLPSSARADWLVMPLLGLSFGSDTNIIDLEDATGLRNVTYGGTVALLSAGGLGLEADVSYVPGFFQREGGGDLVASSSVLSVMGNVIVAAPLSLTRQSLRPYVSGGFGLIRAHLDDVLDLFPVDRNLSGVNIGGGAIGFLSRRTGVRADLRYYKAVGSSDEGSLPIGIGSPNLSFWRASLALVLKY